MYFSSVVDLYGRATVNGNSMARVIHLCTVHRQSIAHVNSMAMYDICV